MRACIQRVKYCTLSIDGEVYSKIGKGLLILVGVREGDTEKEARLLASKCSGIRIFRDENDKMNLSVDDVDGEIMSVSQFTLYADTSHGKRPAFIEAAKPDVAKPLYELFTASLQTKKPVQTGVFGGDMKIELLNDGPVTLILDTDDYKK